MNVEYLSAIVEGEYVIAQANAEVDHNGRFVDDFIPCRHMGEFTLKEPGEVSYMDVSPKQIVVCGGIAGTVSRTR